VFDKRPQVLVVQMLAVMLTVKRLELRTNRGEIRFVHPTNLRSGAHPRRW